MKSSKLVLLSGTIALCIMQLIDAGNSHAVPAFSRAHKVECTTCHTIAPELNEYGDAFLKNSYVYVGKAKKGEKKETVAPAPAPVLKQSADSSGGNSLKIMGEGDSDKLSKLKAGALVAGAT